MHAEVLSGGFAAIKAGAFTTEVLTLNAPGQPGTMTNTDTNAATAPRLFYPVGVGD